VVNVNAWRARDSRPTSFPGPDVDLVVAAVALQGEDLVDKIAAVLKGDDLADNIAAVLKGDYPAGNIAGDLRYNSPLAEKLAVEPAAGNYCSDAYPCLADSHSVVTVEQTADSDIHSAEKYY